MSVVLFRAALTLSASDLGKVHASRETARLPSDVPYVVDNLWEYLRPPAMPCRRIAVYASLKPQLALKSAACFERRHEYTAYRLEISGAHRITQLGVKDARDHEDVRRIQKLVQQRQPAWAAMPWGARQRLARLFGPGCTKADWDCLVSEDDEAASFVAEAIALSRFWGSAHAPVPNSEGELFFELAEASTYRLLPPVYA